MFSVISIDGERRFEFTEGIASGAQNNCELVRARGGVELIFIAIWELGELFPFVFFQVQVYGVAESRSDRPIGAVGYPEHV